MDILNNREWALVIWFFAFIIYALFSSKMNGMRESFKRLLKGFFAKAIISILALMIIYVGAVVFALFKIGLWETHQLKNTIIWAISVAALSLFKITSIKKERSHFFKDLVINNVKLIAIIQFIVGVYTFGLFIELLIVPASVLLGGMLAMAQTDKEYHFMKNPLNIILVISGNILIFYTIYMLVTNFREFARIQTVYDFYIPPLLTIMYLPFIFIMMMFFSYEGVFGRLQYFIKEPTLRRYAKCKSLLKFHVRIGLLERWASILPTQDTSSKNGIRNSIDRMFKIVSVERNPPLVPYQEGWSPYAAKKFLVNEGLETGYYNPVEKNEWYASSDFIAISDDVLPNKISYYIEGNETTATSLEINVSIYSIKSAFVAHTKLLSSAKALLKTALGVDLSGDMEAAIMKGKNQVFKLGDFIATIKRNDWPKSPVGGYDINFILSHA